MWTHIESYNNSSNHQIHWLPKILRVSPVFLFPNSSNYNRGVFVDVYSETWDLEVGWPDLIKKGSLCPGLTIYLPKYIKEMRSMCVRFLLIND